MPYILSQQIHPDIEPQWGESFVYQKKNLYQIGKDKLPPVNYDQHIINSHSITHVESAKHTIKDGKSLDQYLNGNFFYGKCKVVKLNGDHYKQVSDETYQWVVSLQEIKEALNNEPIDKLLLTSEQPPLNDNGFHDPKYVLTLSPEAAEWLVANPSFNLYGTSWKSTDYSPGSPERPIHNIIFRQAVILENLDLSQVPEGKYFLNCFPLNIKGASESPVTPVLFTKDELVF